MCAQYYRGSPLIGVRDMSIGTDNNGTYLSANIPIYTTL